MQNKGLLFIPDISGFSRFVEEVEIEHSRLIIQELLEVLIDANQLNLEVSEVEGDAILFYRYGETPDLGEVYRQVERMFCGFHRRLMSYARERYCYCNACNASINLSLKIVSHYGEFTGYNVKTFNKLIGKDVIVAHQLLKNDIDRHEYWLVTTSLSGTPDPPKDFAGWMHWHQSSKRTDTGEIPFHYTQLGSLKDNVVPDPTQRVDLSAALKVLSFSREYNTDIIRLFHTTGDFNTRPLWRHGIKSVAEISDVLPRVGMKCRCITDEGDMVISSTGYSFSWERIEFTETEEQTKNSTHYTLEKIDDHRSRLTLDYYLSDSLSNRVLFPFTKKREMKDALMRSMANIETMVKQGTLPP